ncbi:hypothetical protein [Megasphaera sp.]|uniref:hypothetical protein n=1 Tax=Megasphaera sp. TaxID=2023260 RepID=UPI0025E99072|nr:hypothetical protein [uncultured Megasphaera sp.]
MNKTIVTSIFVVLALLLSTTWDLLAVKILLTGCLMGWLARTIVANFQAKAKKTAAARKKRIRRASRTSQHSPANQAGQASLTGH